MRTRDLKKHYSKFEEDTRLCGEYNAQLLMEDATSLVSSYKGRAQDVIVDEVRQILFYEHLEQNRLAIRALDQPAVQTRVKTELKTGNLEDFLCRARNIAFDSGDRATVAAFAENYTGPLSPLR